MTRIAPVMRTTPGIQTEALGDGLHQSRLPRSVLADEERHRRGDPQPVLQQPAHTGQGPRPLGPVARGHICVHTFDDHGVSISGRAETFSGTPRSVAGAWSTRAGSAAGRARASTRPVRVNFFRSAVGGPG